MYCTIMQKESWIVFIKCIDLINDILSKTCKNYCIYKCITGVPKLPENTPGQKCIGTIYNLKRH